MNLDKVWVNGQTFDRSTPIWWNTQEKRMSTELSLFTSIQWTSTFLILTMITSGSPSANVLVASVFHPTWLNSSDSPPWILMKILFECSSLSFSALVFVSPIEPWHCSQRNGSSPHSGTIFRFCRKGECKLPICGCNIHGRRISIFLYYDHWSSHTPFIACVWL